MNTSFDPFDLVNTYGAFGSVGRERYEIVLEGTDATTRRPERALAWSTSSRASRATERRPCLISPYHYRLDWQMWFAAMPGADTEPWFVHLVAKLLEGDPTRRLLAPGPFLDRPPRDPRPLLPLRVHSARRAHPRLLEADARGRIFPAAYARRPATTGVPAGPGLGLGGAAREGVRPRGRRSAARRASGPRGGSCRRPRLSRRCRSRCRGPPRCGRRAGPGSRSPRGRRRAA